MTKEQAVVYLRFSGFSEEQIKAIEGAFTCPSAGIDCEDCPAYEPKTGHWEWVRYDGIAGNWHCSECRTIIPHMPEETDNTPIYKWCPMCGAKMQEVKDNG